MAQLARALMTVYDTMVHYDPRQASQTPPRICPKCGSHRTEIVGMTEVPPAIVLRCNACGARSSVPMEEKDTKEKPVMDDVTVELEVIQSVGRALARLSDAEAQHRVIRWINDRFQQTDPPSSTHQKGPGAMTLADPFLGVDELSDLFEDANPMMHSEMVEREALALAPEPEPDAGLDSLVRGFVSDFQRVALAWQGA